MGNIGGKIRKLGAGGGGHQDLEGGVHHIGRIRRIRHPLEQHREALAMLQHPVVVVAWQQLALVQRAGPGCVAGPHCGFKLDRVAVAGLGRELHALAVGQQHRAGCHARRFEQPAQR